MGWIIGSNLNTLIAVCVTCGYMKKLIADEAKPPQFSGAAMQQAQP